MRTAIALLSLLLATPALAQQAPAAPAPAAPAAEAAVFNVVQGQGSVTYHMVHKAHKFDGKSAKVEGKARILPDGKTQVMLRAPVESFDSGNSNRDAHMKETVEAARYPIVELKAIGEGVTMPTTFPATVQKTFKAQLSFHGVTNTVDLPVTLTFESASKVKAAVSFSVSLDSFKIERPSLLFIKVEDEMKLDVTLNFSR